MSENMPQTGTGVERLRLWRERFRETLAPSPLEDAEQLAARLDLTHAHPSGIAKLFASGQVSLDSLFRDNGMLRAAGRRIERVLDDRAAKSRVSGMAELSLVVGIATWSGRQMPVLLYPVDVERRGDSVTTGTTIRFTGRVHLNSSWTNATCSTAPTTPRVPRRRRPYSPPSRIWRRRCSVISRSNGIS